MVKKELLQLEKKLRSNILLVVDDAYFEYVKDKKYLSGLKNCFSKFKKCNCHKNLFKNLWTCWFRVGYGYGPKNLIYALNQIKPPFNINRAALFAAASL